MAEFMGFIVFLGVCYGLYRLFRHWQAKDAGRGKPGGSTHRDLK